MTENWYLVLGLEFDPNPVTDEEIIEQKIEEKRKFWARNANDLMHGPEYRKYTQMLSNVRKDMIGEENIRQELIQDAIQRAYEPIDEMLQDIGKTEITEEIADRIAKKLGSSVSVVKGRARRQGINISQKETDYQKLYDKYYKEKPENMEKYNAMKTQLTAFNANNLYEFLFPKKKWQESCKNPSQRMLDAAREKRKTEFYKNDNLSGTGSKLCAQCEEIFSTSVTRKEYDNVIKYNERKAIFDRAKEICEITGEVSEEAYIKSITELSRIIKDKEKAEEIFKAFCKQEKLAVQISNRITTGKNSEEKKRAEKAVTEQAEARKAAEKRAEEEAQARKRAEQEAREAKEAEKRAQEQAQRAQYERERQKSSGKKEQGCFSRLIGWAIMITIISMIWNYATDKSKNNDENQSTNQPTVTVAVTRQADKGTSDKDSTNESITKGENTQPTQGAKNQKNPTNTGTPVPTKSVVGSDKGTPILTQSEDSIVAIRECMAEFLDSIQIIKGEYKDVSVKKEFLDTLRTLRKRAGELEEGVFTTEENGIAYMTVAELSEDYDYGEITVEMQKNSTASCKVVVTYTDFSRVIVLARMLTVEKTEGEEDISDSRWNKLYLESVEEAAGRKETRRQEELTFYLEYNNGKWQVSGCEENEKAYNALAGGTLQELDYDWLERYEAGGA